MPIYEYQCKKCKHVFEKIMKFSDAPLKNCPDCGAKNSLEQLISAPAIQFKGEGWYVTDYAKKGGKDKAAKEGAASDKASKEGTEASSAEKKTEEKTGETKSETKSESKSESKKETKEKKGKK